MTLRLVVIGLYMGLALFILLLAGDAVAPGMLFETAFSDLGIITIFALLIGEAFFSFGKHD